MITKVGTVGVYVDDQHKSVEFWTTKLGFEIRNRTDMQNGSFWLEVAPAGAETCLVLYPRSLMPNYRELKPSVVFHCQDIDRYCAGLKEKGVVFTRELAPLPWGKFASFRDEDGNEFGLRGN